MRKRLIERITHAKKGSLGYTLTEMLVVVGIIAIVCAIAIPSIIAIRDALRFAQANNYAKSIFLAAQQNLTEMRSDGGLGPVQRARDNLLTYGINTRIERHHCAFPDSEWSSEYVFTASGDSYLKTTYDLVLPVNSVEGTLRNEQVVIEYNPITGNVYAVFYCEDDFDLLENYKNGTVSRAKADRKRDMVGYYDGSGLSSANLEMEHSQAQVEFTNGEEGVVTVRIPMPSQYYTNHSIFAEGLEVKLTIRGESSWGGVMEIVVKESGTTDNCTLHEGNTMLVTYPLDSLRDFMSFANLSAEITNDSLTTLTDDSFSRGTNILPGDNVTIQADVTFVNTDNNPAVQIAPGILAGVNPMFDYLLPSPTEPNKYILAVSNGRNLQNLNAIHPEIADSIKSVVFTGDINWNTTTTYYNSKYGSGTEYTNLSTEAPARSLPYFVPIHNEHLFGTATFVYMDGGSAASGIQGLLQSLLNQLLGSDFVRDGKVPTLTDELDTRVVNGKQIGDTHATIDGQGHKVSFLNVDSTFYKPCAITYYALGDTQIVDYYFSGLFGYANTTINDLHVVNPRIKGHNFVSGIYMDPATGALLGAGGYNTLITNCSTYLDSSAEGFNWSYYGTGMQTDYSSIGSMSWYGVSGEGAVGGLVGYAKSHRTVVGELKNDDTRYLAFSNSFAAVPVSGNVRGTTVKDYGYSNGVGGFIGNSQLTNFYNCYASGNVLARNTIYSSKYNDNIATLLGLGGNARLAQGAGGFVGTSHGTRYTNCFASGNVTNNNGNASTGGFVGMMCYDATKKYGHHSDDLAEGEVSQHTVFDSCYAVGMCTNKSGAFLEAFSGSNGRIVINYANIRTYHTGDYYKLLAPYAMTHYNSSTKTYDFPRYSELYIFKDSYYLSQYAGVSGVSEQSPSNKCAKPITYDELVNLHLKYDDNSSGGWLERQVQAVRSFALDVTDINPLVSQILAEIFTLDFNDIFQGLLGNETEDMKKVNDILNSLRTNRNYEVYFTLDKYRGQCLVANYLSRYTEGFPSLPWENATDATTHYYGIASNKVYPFPKLNGMDFYGQWPEKTLNAGLAYYEVYNDGTTGYYFDREDTSKLRNSADTIVVSDGYCIFTANKNDLIAVYVNDVLVAQNLTPATNADPITMESATSPDKNSYYAVNLPNSVLSVASDGRYYFKIAFYISNASTGTSKTVTAYFNPNVAVSQVHSENRPTQIPSSIIIRSARQLAELMREPAIWAYNCNYIQHLNIDANAYTASSYSEADRAAILAMIDAGGSIGSEAVPFQGHYSGHGYAEQAQIVNFKPGFTAAADSNNGTAGLFGVVGSKGLIDCLEIRFNEPVTMDGAVGSAALLAGISTGTIQEIDMVLEDTASVTAGTSAGLLVGTLGGTMNNCTLTISDAVTLTAENAGAVIGRGTNGVLQNITLVQNDHTDSASGTTVGLTVNADNAGGFAGSLTEMKAENVAVTLDTVTANADALGGYVGSINGGSGSSVSIQIDTALHNTKTPEEGKTTYAAGMAGKSLGVQYNQAEVTLNGQITGSSAAGMFGSIAEGKVQGSNVKVNGTVSGTVDAAGFAVQVGEGNGVIESTIAYLQSENSRIQAGSRAAGFAVELGGTTLGTGVRMGQYLRGQNSLNVVSTAAIQGNSQAAGYACTVTGSVNNGTVMGAAQITSATGTAAGFAADITGSGRVAASGVTPALGDQTSDYRFNSNSNLNISGFSAAGFAGAVGKSASIENSYALGSISVASDTQGSADGSDETASDPIAAGFVLTNDGEINGSTANISISGGYAFAATNNGTVKNCYGWYGDGAALDNTTVVYEPVYVGVYRSSYFVDIDILEGEDEGVEESVTLFDAAGRVDTMLPSALSNALSRLNVENGYEWFGPATYGAKPYSTITPATYSYPMLRTHYGDWVTTPQYAYGVMYYEKHVSGNTTTWKYNILDLTDPTKDGTIEEHSLSCSNSDFTDYDSFIAEAGYAVFCKTNDDPNSLFAADRGWTLGDKIPLTDADGNATEFRTQVYETFLAKVADQKDGRYSFYVLASDGALTFDGASDDVSVVTWYANAINVAGTEQDPYSIRTPKQFASVGEMPASCFKQMHTIHADGFETISDFTGIYDGNNLALTISEANTWIDTLSGNVSNVYLTVNGNVTQPVIDTVAAAGTVTLTDIITVQGETDAITVQGEVADNACLFNTVLGRVTIGDIKTGNVYGSLINTINGTVQTGAITTGDVYDSLFVQVAGDEIAASLTTGDVSTGIVPADAAGWLVTEINSANVTLGDITVDSSYIQVVEEPETTDENGETIPASTKEITCYADAGTMIGSISNGSVVTGSDVTLSNTVLADYLVVDISASTVSGFKVTADSVQTSLICCLSGIAASDTTVAQPASVSGIQVTVGGSTTFSGSGLLVNILGSNTTVSNCAVSTETITVSVIPEHEEGNTPTKSFGGITGVVPADAVLTDNTVSTTLNVTGQDNMLTIVGGLAAINRGQIVGTEAGSSYADMNVTYTQTAGDAANGVADDMVGIGGLVGWMRPGSSITDVSASGAINLTGEGSGEGSSKVSGKGKDNYFIGGAIAYDDNASYTNVTTAVAVSDAWAGTQLVPVDGQIEVSRINPSGKGVVGKFVGYVSGGTFTNCSATNATGAYQFLGQIAVTAKDIANDNLYTSPEKQSVDSFTLDYNPTPEELAQLGFHQVTDDTYTYHTYSAKLTNCSFLWPDSQTYYQSFDSTYIYGNTLTPRDLYKAVNVGTPSFEEVDNNPRYASIYYERRNVTRNNIATDYYIYIAETENYQPVFVDYVCEEKRGFIVSYYVFTYKFKYKNDDGSYSEYYSSVELDDFNITTAKYDGQALFKLVYPDSLPSYDAGSEYMIVTPDGLYAFGVDGNRIRFDDEFDLVANGEIQKAIWTLTGSNNTVRWVNKSNQNAKLALQKDVGRTVYNNSDGRYISVRDEGVKNGASTFSLTGEKTLRFSDGKFNLDYGSYDFHIYRVNPNGKKWVTKFNLRSEIDYLCVPTDANGIPVALPTADVTEEEVAETLIGTTADFVGEPMDNMIALIPGSPWKNEN